MNTIRCKAALLLLLASFIAGAALAQGVSPTNTIVAKDSFSMAEVPPLKPVQIELELKGPSWEVVTNLDPLAKLQWKTDVRCATRLKSLSVKHPDGASSTAVFNAPLKASDKGLQTTLSLQSFGTALLRQRCRDIANKTFQTAVDAEDKHELEKQQNAFALNQQALTELDGEAQKSLLFLSAQCTTADGTKVISSVADKKLAPTLQVICCTDGGCPR